MKYLLASVAGMLGICLAQAQWNDDAKQCAEVGGNAEAQIAHCTKALSSGELSAPNRAVTLSNRGAAWFMKHDLPHAMDDFSAALKIDGKLAAALLGRGQVNFAQGQYALAATDLEQAQHLQSGPYVTIWLFLARLRNGDDGRSELAANVKTLNGDKWPMPILDWLTGKIKTRAVLAKAHDPDPKIELARQCEANFYVGEWQLAKNFKKFAVGHLNQAVAKCPKTFVEFVAASAEVKRLK